MQPPLPQPHWQLHCDDWIVNSIAAGASADSAGLGSVEAKGSAFSTSMVAIGDERAAVAADGHVVVVLVAVATVVAVAAGAVAGVVVVEVVAAAAGVAGLALSGAVLQPDAHVVADVPAAVAVLVLVDAPVVVVVVAVPVVTHVAPASSA